jgi:hypothetical protein
MKRLWILLPAFGTLFLCGGSFAEEEILYDPHAKRDPFMPLVTANSRDASGLVGIETADDIRIEGIVYDPKGSVVIVNGSLMKEGEESVNLKVVSIKPTGVLFLINGVEEFRPLYREESNKEEIPSEN